MLPLALVDINIVEIISTHQKLIFVLDRKDLDKSLNAFEESGYTR